MNTNVNKKKKYIIANWKMKLSFNESLVLAKEFKELFKTFDENEIVICPDFIGLSAIAKIFKNSKINLGAQDVFWEQKGAFTGEISPANLKEVGCSYVVIGHSERRQFLLENYSMIHQKVKAVLNIPGLIPVICVGEELKDKKSGKRDYVLLEQLQLALGGIDLLPKQKIIIAYEPVWAIGSGASIEASDAEYAHKIIKVAVNDILGSNVDDNNIVIIYGGSINSDNVKDFLKLENVEGLLVGGAGLKAREFYKIAKIFK